jgi:hypothetical protein
MKTAFYTCTRKKEIADTFAFKSLRRLSDKIELFYDCDNTKGLSERYNEILKEHSKSFDNIVFLHDDVYVDDLYVVEKLEKAHTVFDIVGLAGGINPKISKPALWHLMCGGFGGGNLRGAVAHPTGNKANDQIFMTSFGPTPSRVAILDGLFLSVSTKCYLEQSWKFNENYKFHHYDIASSIDANKAKLKLGVVPIWCIHSSPGLMSLEDKMFTDSQQKFVEEYS